MGMHGSILGRFYGNNLPDWSIRTSQHLRTTTTALLFGEAVDALGEAKRAEFSNHFDHGTFICAMRLRLADLCWLYTPTAFKKSCKVVKKFADYFVQQALTCQKTQGRDRASEHYPFILGLYNSVQDPELVRDQLVNVLLAGRDTTTCSMSWALYAASVFEVIRTRLTGE
ncbi:hypothetical protein LTR70_010164 [Exophiala xenobiotica]|nr:hypothetical protein LTR70_010164 [Exophiala xenobiotica]